MAAPVGSSGSAASAASAATRDTLYDAILNKNEVETPHSFLDSLEEDLPPTVKVTVTTKNILRRRSSSTVERSIYDDHSPVARVSYTQGRSNVQDFHHFFTTVTIDGHEAFLTGLLQAHLNDGTACGAAVFRLEEILIAQLARTDTVEEALRGLFDKLHVEVRAALSTNRYGGTSILLVLQTADRVYIANSGRSRAILMNKTHTNFQACPLTCRTSATGIEGEDSGCLITSIQKNVETEIKEGSTRVGYREGDLILLANQGFTNIVSDLYARIALDRMEGKPQEERTRRLVRGAFDEGSTECLVVMLLTL